MRLEEMGWIGNTEGDSKFQEKYSLCSQEWEWSWVMGVESCWSVNGRPAILDSLALSPLGELLFAFSPRRIIIHRVRWLVRWSTHIILPSCFPLRCDVVWWAVWPIVVQVLGTKFLGRTRHTGLTPTHDCEFLKRVHLHMYDWQHTQQLIDISLLFSKMGEGRRQKVWKSNCIH